MNGPPLPSWCDADLVRAAREGQSRAFAALIERYRQVVLGTVWAALQDFDDAEDATQETFTLAYRHLGDLKDAAKFSSWVSSISANVVRKWLGKRALDRRRFVRLDDVPHSLHEPAGCEARPLPCGAESLREAFGALSPEDRTVTTLFYLVGLDQQEIAELLNIPVGTVKSRLHRSRSRLKRRVLRMAKETFQANASREDYGRAVIEGMRGVIHWKKLLEKEGLAGWRSGNPLRSEGSRLAEVWSRSGEAIIGEDMDGCGERLIVGDASWKDYEFSVLVTPLSGGNAQVQFRLSEDGKRYYMFDMLLGLQAIAVSMASGDGALRKLSVVNAPLELGREYDVLIAARDASLTTYLDGQLVNQVTDMSYHSGPVVLSVWQSKTAFRDPRIRLL